MAGNILELAHGSAHHVVPLGVTVSNNVSSHKQAAGFLFACVSPKAETPSPNRTLVVQPLHFDHHSKEARSRLSCDRCIAI